MKRPAVSILVTLSVCHFLNDLLQTLLPAIYPMLKTGFNLNYTQIGLITLTNSATSSVLQPVVGFYTVMVFVLGFVAMEAPRHPKPLSPGERDAVVERMESFFASLPTAVYPNTVRLAPELARMTTEEQFDGGVAAIIAGLRARLSHPSDD